MRGAAPRLQKPIGTPDLFTFACLPNRIFLPVRVPGIAAFGSGGRVPGKSDGADNLWATAGPCDSRAGSVFPAGPRTPGESCRRSPAGGRQATNRAKTPDRELQSTSGEGNRSRSAWVGESARAVGANAAGCKSSELRTGRRSGCGTPLRTRTLMLAGLCALRSIKKAGVPRCAHNRPFGTVMGKEPKSGFPLQGRAFSNALH
jgi:hypothetical protein